MLVIEKNFDDLQRVLFPFTNNEGKNLVNRNIEVPRAGRVCGEGKIPDPKESSCPSTV